MAKEASKTSDKSADKAETKPVKAKSEAPKAAKASDKAKPAEKTKSADKPKSADKAKPAKAGSSRVVIVQTRSPIGRPAAQRQTLIGLKLNKIGRASSLEDTPAVRGMIAKVAHLVSIVEEGGSR